MMQSENLVELLCKYRSAQLLVERQDLIAEIIEIISPSLEHFIRRQNVGTQLEDLLQDSLAAIAAGLHAFRGNEEATLWAWCFRIARRTTYHYLDAQKRSFVEYYEPDDLEKVSEKAVESLDSSGDEKLDARFFIDELRKSASKCLDLMTKRFVEGWDYQTIADTFELISAEAARVRILRCRKEAWAILGRYI